MRERLELVRSFAELRTGMIVVYRPCAVCHKPHRAILLGRSPGWLPDGTEEPSMGMLPQPECRGPGEWAIGPTTVARKVVFRVVDPGLEDSTSTPTRKKRSVRA